MEKRKKRVLMVDDDFGLSALVKLNLEQSGDFHVWTEAKATRGLMAAQMFQPDVILLDLQMPKLTGDEVAAQFKEHADLKDVPIIFYTSLAESDQPTAVQNQRFLSKTAEFPELVQCLEEVLASKAA